MDSDDKVRLPELPIFKRYSLALRQEFASPREILGILERSASKIHASLDKAREKTEREERARQERIDVPELEPEAPIEEAPLEEGGEEPDSRPFWEVDSDEDQPVNEPSTRRPRSPRSGSTRKVKSKVKPKAAKAKPASKAKRKVAKGRVNAPEIVRIPHDDAAPRRSGSKAKAKKPAARAASKPAARRTSKPVRGASKSSRSKPAKSAAVRKSPKPKPKTSSARRTTRRPAPSKRSSRRR